MMGYRLISASLDAGHASATTCLPRGTPLLRKDVGTSPASADAPWLVFVFCLYHHSFFRTPSAHVLYLAPFDTSLGPCQHDLPLNLPINISVS